MDEQEQQYRARVASFPDSPLTQFALGRYLLEKGRFQEAVAPLEAANRLQPEYAAALVALGDAYAGAGETQKAKSTFGHAREVALAQQHPSLAEEIDERLGELE